MTDIVERLENPETVYPEDQGDEDWLLEKAAAEEIKRLRRELDDMKSFIRGVSINIDRMLKEMQ